MKGKSWERFAQERGLQLEEGRIFGWISGLLVTVSSSLGEIRLHVYLSLNKADGEDVGRESVQKRNDAAALLRAVAQEQGLPCIRTPEPPGSISVAFRAVNKMMAKLGACLDQALPRLNALGYGQERLCAHCGEALGGDSVPVRVGDDVVPMHSQCADDHIREAAFHQKPKKGSLLLGAAGALLGAIVGAVPWAVLYAMGYIASVAALIAVFLVDKGYRLLGGRQGRARIAIVLLFVVLSVALGHAAGITYDLSREYDNTAAQLTRYETMSMEKNEFIKLVWTQYMWEDSQAVGGLLAEVGSGLFLGLLGCLGIFLKIARETVPQKPRRLTSSM